LARNSYSFERRQRDLAKKKKAEEKRAKKATRPAGSGAPIEGMLDDGTIDPAFLNRGTGADGEPVEAEATSEAEVVEEVRS
jgi:hypothetical protein